MKIGMDENIASGIFSYGDVWRCVETKTVMIHVQSMINATKKIRRVGTKECLRDLFIMLPCLLEQLWVQNSKLQVPEPAE